MGFLATLIGGSAGGQPPPHDDYWYNPVGPISAAGVAVSPETALAASAVWACNRILSETIAALPLLVYRQMTEDERAVARQHPVFRLLHDQPNDWQTAIEFRQMLTTGAVMRGAGFARIVAGTHGPVDRLEPLQPECVTPVRLARGGQRYRVAEPGQATETLTDDEVFRVNGLTLDGVTPVSVIRYARESIGLSLAAERYGATVFSQGARPGGVLETDGPMSDPAAERLRTDWERLHGGLGQAHRTAVLTDGVKWRPMSMTSEDAQYLETREFEIAEIARWFGVPLHMIGETAKSTSWGTGIEQQSIGFVIYTLLPWLKRWEQAISRDLIVATGTYYAEHVVAGLLRGDTKSRYEAYSIGIQNGWLSPNDVRRLENMNPVAGGDTYLQPLNMVPLGTAPTPSGGEQPPADNADGHYRRLLVETAGRIARREVAALTRLNRRDDLKADDWQRAVRGWAEEHGAHVAEALQVDRQRAANYAAARAEELIRHGDGALDGWAERTTPDLVRLAREEAG